MHFEVGNGDFLGNKNSDLESWIGVMKVSLESFFDVEKSDTAGFLDVAGSKVFAVVDVVANVSAKGVYIFDNGYVVRL